MIRAEIRRVDGSTVVEMVVAATITLIALGVVVEGVLPAVRALEDVVSIDRRRDELAAAAESVVRAVRGARPGVTWPAVTGHATELALGGAAEASVRVALADGELWLDADSPWVGGTPLPMGRLITGLDMEASGFALLDVTGEVASPGAPISGVVITLVADGHQVTRVATVRIWTHLDGSSAW